jgi:hypothetical protein
MMYTLLVIPFAAVLRLRLWPCNGGFCVRVRDQASVQERGRCGMGRVLPTDLPPAAHLGLGDGSRR